MAMPATDNAAVLEEDATASLQASLTNLAGTSEDQAALPLTDAQQTADADSTDTQRKQFKDFLAQVSDIAFGPNHEREKGPDFAAYGKKLVEINVLPAFAISDDTKMPLQLALNTGQDQAQRMLTHFHDAYFTHKA